MPSLLPTVPGIPPPEGLSPESFLNILGVVYLHRKTREGGDLYLTPFGAAVHDLLEVENWLEPEWFKAHRERLEGTSTVYRVPTREVAGRSMDLVVKYCRVGEDVPMNTHTLAEYLNAEFNSPWEEFSLVMELREGRHGPPGVRIATQEPLAIHIPPESMQLWQSGRSEERMGRIQRRHPGVGLDILRQYQLVYGWIPGRNLVEALLDLGRPRDALGDFPWVMNRVVIAHMREKGFSVADMKPVHIIFRAPELAEIAAVPERPEPVIERLVEQGRYAVIDYELLLREPDYEAEVHQQRRHTYLDTLVERFTATPLPAHLDQTEILGVPYVHGHVESTGGELWVVGRNPRLFDFFLPERWRRTPSVRLSERNDVNYTLTKDHVHLVWKVSRVGEHRPGGHGFGFNSPFEECAIALALAAAGIPTTHVRAIYRTGSRKLEASPDRSRFDSHAGLRGTDGRPILGIDHNYILLNGYYNGEDAWVAHHDGALCRPLGLDAAVAEGRLEAAVVPEVVAALRTRLTAAGWDAARLCAHDLVLPFTPDGEPLRDATGGLAARLCDFSFIRPLGGGLPHLAVVPG